jgi:hypothetical protein
MILDETNTKNNIAMAIVQVAFSRKSAVFLTPMYWFDPAKFEASPPPFEFCTKITSTISTAIIKVKTVINTKRPIVSSI